MKIPFFAYCKDNEERKSLYRRLSKCFHPDRGGDNELMQCLNAEYENPNTLNQKSSQSEKDKKEYVNPAKEIEALEMFEKIFFYADLEPSFNSDFVKSVFSYYKKFKRLTDKQYQALKNTMEKFDVENKIKQKRETRGFPKE